MSAVTLLPVELAVDKNGDGVVGSIGDQTTSSEPYRFWVNNDSDTEEDKEESGGDPDNTDDMILTQRDLEDFTRLHFYIGGLHQQIVDGDVEVGLLFDEISDGTPRIKIYRASDEGGGSSQYIRDETAAGEQLAGDFGNSIATISAAGVTWLAPDAFSQIANNKGNAYFIFEGLLEGKGKLTVALRKDGSEFVRFKLLDLHLMDVRNMYQRVKITPDNPDSFTDPGSFAGEETNPTIIPPIPDIDWVWEPNGNEFIEDPEEEKEYLVFVHGWRMTYEGSQKYAESMFKRFWHRGYRGRYAFVRWPTYSEETSPVGGLLTYNDSDYRAWLSGEGVAAFVNSLPSNYVRNIAAHSMGNIVVSSALREGLQVDNYALLNAAIPAMCYDGDENLYEFALVTPDGDTDPITKGLGFKEKISNTNGARLINFYLEDDTALTGKFNVPGFGEAFGWEENNEDHKPQLYNLGQTGYHYDPLLDPGEKIYINFLTEYGRYIRFFEESAAFATTSRTKAVGAEERTDGVINENVDLNDDNYKFGDTHSAQWLWRIQKTDLFHHDLMEKFGLNPTP